MEQEQMLMDKIQTAKELFADLQSAPEEALWEDVEEVDDDQVVMEGRKVKKSDVHKMLHFAKTTNLMDDTTRIRFRLGMNDIKAGTFQISQRTVSDSNMNSKMK